MVKCRISVAEWNREAKNFAYNFVTKSTGDVLNFWIRMIGDKNIEFGRGEKNFQ